MKRVTTHLSFGQLFFILFTIALCSAAAFYLGFKVAPQKLGTESLTQTSFLPQNDINAEIEKWLAQNPVDYSFFEVVQDKRNQEFAQLKAEEVIKKIEMANESPTQKIKTEETPIITQKPEEKSTVQNISPELVESELPQSLDLALALSKPLKEETPAPVLEKKPDIKKEVELKPSPDLKESPSEILAEAEVTQTQYLLQIGSFDSLKKAEKAKALWAKRGYAPEVVKAQIPGKGEWYRLRLGLYYDISEIKNHQKSIQNKYRESAVILPIQ